jgi:hypothetical protein
MIILQTLEDSSERAGAGRVYQVDISWRIIEMDRGEVDVRHRDVRLGYNR